MCPMTNVDASPGNYEFLYPNIWQSIQWLLRGFTEKHKGLAHGGIIEKVWGLPKSVGFILWEPQMSIQNVIAIQPVEIFQFVPKQ